MKTKYVVVRLVLTATENANEAFGPFPNQQQADTWISERPNPREYYSLPLQPANPKEQS